MQVARELSRPPYLISIWDSQPRAAGCAPRSSKCCLQWKRGIREHFWSHMLVLSIVVLNSMNSLIGAEVLSRS